MTEDRGLRLHLNLSLVGRLNLNHCLSAG